MKKLMITALAAFFSFAALNAQDGKPGHPGMRKHHPRMDMMKNLNLTGDQETQAKKINEDFRQQMQDLRAKEDKITVKDWKAQMKKFRKIIMKNCRGC